MHMYFWNLDQFNGSMESAVGVGLRALPKGSSLTVPISKEELHISLVIVGTRTSPFSASRL